MIVTESKLRKIIRRLLISEQTEIVGRSGALTAAQAAIAALKIVDLGSPIPLTTDRLESDIAEITLSRIAKFLGGEAVGAAAATALQGAFLLAAVVGAFTALPALLKSSIESLDTVEGYLKNFRSILGKPIDPEDISDTRDLSIPKFGEVEWTPDLLIDFIAAGMSTPEGRSLVGVLVASEFKHDGLRKRGPIISQKFMNAIQIRRRAMAEDAREKIHREIIRVAEEKMNTPAGQQEVVDLVRDLGIEFQEEDSA
tara:strand:+ start:1168 stop:1932 length:765 start_codon:yes stop_codon:yes gene_type:complete